MAKLISPSTQVEVELRVLGFEFAFAPSPDEDDWLNIEIRAVVGSQRWRKTAPCLMVRELAGLVDDLKRWEVEPACEETLAFTEPSLQFRRVKETSGAQKILIGFDYELHPDLHDYAGDPKWVEFDVPTTELRKFKDELARALRRLPPKPPPTL